MVTPPPDSAPTPGEIMRRLDDVVRRFEDVSKDVREFRNWAERLYVPRGEWVEGRRADQGYIKDVAKDVEELKSDRATAAQDAKTKAASDLSFRRAITVAVIAAALSGVISVVVLLSNIFFGAA